VHAGEGLEQQPSEHVGDGDAALEGGNLDPGAQVRRDIDGQPSTEGAAPVPTWPMSWTQPDATLGAPLPEFRFALSPVHDATEVMARGEAVPPSRATAICRPHQTLAVSKNPKDSRLGKLGPRIRETV
jgi:hypothetical protein